MSDLQAYALNESRSGGFACDVDARIRVEVKTLDMMARAACGPYVMQLLRIAALFSQWSGNGGSFAPDRILRWKGR
jgi:hypothetical protein